MTRETYLKRSLGTLARRIKESRVLLVGAGGIGCELLKNLLLSGFGEIHIIDLDTIDLSNLNRQFLFRFEHIKKPKALVAKEVAHKFQPGAKLEAYHANIKDDQFNVDWFATFDVVFNALDNLDARRHVNRMCLAANVPLVESGTTGFNGQVQVIKKGVTECYDCNSKEVPKSFPVCTIRSTPSQPIHCIVWAKSYLFPELFGISEDDSSEFDHSEDAENSEEIENLRREAQALKEIRQSMGSEEFAQKVFEKVFQEDIDRLRGMEDMWKTRDPPEPLDFHKLQEESSGIEPVVSCNDQKVWTLAEDFVVFKDSLDRLSKRLKTLQDTTKSDVKPILVFDKDDVDTLDFVAATANLRASIFKIDPKSKFDTKQMAGNIIPAIATTNAMTAGLCVLQAYKVLRGEYDQAKMVFLERSGVRAINSDSLQPPNPNCPVCSVTHARLKIDPQRATLENLVQDILRSQLGYGEEFSINTELGTIYDPDLEDNLPKKLTDLGVKNECFITVIDEEDDQPRVNLELIVLATEASQSTEDQKPASLESVPDIPRKPKAPAPAAPETEPEPVNGAGKRKRDADEAGLSNGDNPAKRVAAMSIADGDGANPIVLDEANGGAILIDDD
ncbi:E1 ubiquitin-activating protein uba2 [Aspergillus tubingensis]|uniref:Ubiquitin-activating enzyme E1-like n=1 Tax=Aspergillus tubingensis TaxID=5068 RepID=A0A8H3SWF8_ASPTU|nr:ubiquitin-like activating enzyme [Aspergillus tubingensis]GFN16621.1 ubiquitin-like activating enzyme [Aspergillus tubingensis]GLA76515.1 E1 ubiquitin-activating protein uba2 [Aspergillus tubingensis]GLA81710.1 E1 ubiquitin-activating protein uba2 [Aspergillus tubingensis]GLA97610.1 E1 ubiquitin-activating protein uba2 [Aspergillus tubingensis]GLB17175.1 E1 ubiquitin-activating protein uba2 [Aspergillus tubingensis]